MSDQAPATTPGAARHAGMPGGPPLTLLEACSKPDFFLPSLRPAIGGRIEIIS